MKVFSKEKFIEDMEERKYPYTKDWVTECDGLTKKECTKLGFLVVDDWFIEKPSFEVGKKYRYVGGGKTCFNNHGNMEYIKTGVHKVHYASHKGLLVMFKDDPSMQPWCLDPKDFEEVVEEAKEYYVYNPKTFYTKVRYKDLDKAKKEAERLAKLYNSTFEILEVVARCAVDTKIVWEG